MEKFEEQGMISQRITGIEKRIGSVGKRVDDLEDKVDSIDNKHNDRHLEMVKLTTELKGTSKATEQNTERMANSIENLVGELKQSNSRTDDRFKEVNDEVTRVRAKVEGKEHEATLRLEEKKLSNKTILGIISGVFILLQVFIQFIGPLFFK